MHSSNMQAVDPSPRETVGVLLRNSRLSHGLDIAQVADALRIRLSFLTAIEEGRHQDLPGPTYAVGFVRAYADYMGLDGNEIVRRYKEETSIVPRKAELEFPTPVSEGGLPTGAMILMAALLGAAVYGGWYWMSSEDRTVAALIQDVPERFTSLLSSEPDATEPVVEATAPATEAAVQPVTPVTPAPSVAAPAPVAPAEEGAVASPPPAAEAPSAAAEAEPPATAEAVVPPVEEEDPAPVEDRTVPEQAPTEPASTEPVTESEQVAATPAPVAQPDAPAASAAVAAPVTAPQADAEPVPEAEPETEVAAIPAAPPMPDEPFATSGTVYGAPAGSTRVVLVATDRSWIQVNQGGDVVFNRTLKAGERFQVPQRDGLVLTTGNAGGLQIQVDGKALPALGDQGQVRRGIQLDAERLVTN